jgi:hypothetical protein
MEVIMLYRRNENTGAPLEARRTVVLEKIQEEKNKVIVVDQKFGSITAPELVRRQALRALEESVRRVKTLRRLEKLVLRNYAEYGIYDEVQRAFLEMMPR